MGNSPAVQLDFSTFQPLQKQGSNPAPSGTSGVTLDMSTLQGSQDNPGFTEMIRKIREAGQPHKSFAAQQFPQLQTNPTSRTLYNMTAAMSGQKQATPEDEEQAQAGRKAGFISGAVTAGMGALGGPLAAPTVTTESVGTGILNQTGQEIMREITKAGPSIGREAVKATLAWTARHPYVSMAAYEGLRRAGVPVPNVIGWLAKAANEVKP
jgi:hypothetical protein